MAGSVLLVGNGPNQLGGGYSWSALLDELREFVRIGAAREHDAQKPFPLLYEELFLHGHRAAGREEADLKAFIAEHTKRIEPNPVHARLMALNCEHVLTTNYDHALELAAAPPCEVRDNLGYVNEQRYNLFRHYQVGETKVWPIHGDQRFPATITLGYEQYSGYLQQMRLYTAVGLSYAKGPLKSFVRRVREGDQNIYSWLDLFFTRNVFIVGLSLDFVEFHLWWLLTFRARAAPRSKLPMVNRIVYLSRGGEERDSRAAAKLGLFRASQVETVLLGDGNTPWEDYYREVTDWLTVEV